MSAWPKIRVALLLVGIFGAGAAAGALVMARIGVEARKRVANADMMGPTMLRRWVEPLKLSKEQTEKVKPLVESTAKQLAETRRESFKQTTEILVAFERALSAELTKEQREKFEEQQRERRERWKRSGGRKERAAEERPGLPGERPPLPGVRPPLPDDRPPLPGGKPPSEESKSEGERSEPRS